MGEESSLNSMAGTEVVLSLRPLQRDCYGASSSPWVRGVNWPCVIPDTDSFPVPRQTALEVDRGSTAH